MKKEKINCVKIVGGGLAGAEAALYLASKGVKMTNFIRFEKGEGLQKKEENFADEIAAQVEAMKK